jgi:ferrous iron transport protein A
MPNTLSPYPSLADLPSGANAVLLRFDSGKEAIGRLTSLGFTPGASISMVQNSGRGPLVVIVRGTRIALGRGEAQKILVSKEA